MLYAQGTKKKETKLAGQNKHKGINYVDYHEKLRMQINSSNKINNEKVFISVYINIYLQSKVCQ